LSTILMLKIDVLTKSQITATEKERNGLRGRRDYQVRFELAIFSDSELLIIGVTSIANLKDHGPCGLLITSKDGTDNSAFVGQIYNTIGIDEETVYPGLPLFQEFPYQSPHHDVVILERVNLTFATSEERSHLKGYIYSTQPPPKKQSMH
jgi:hypothetical protein